MKVTAFIGSARKKHTYKNTVDFLEKLKSYGDVEYELVQLSDYKLEPCTGCQICMKEGEVFCPLKDDKNLLVEKMINSDGVLFTSPNYIFHVSAYMKLFLDRLAYFCHRPYFFGKTFTSIVPYGIYGGSQIAKYFNFIGATLGFNVIKGSVINTLEPMTEKSQLKIDKIIDAHSKKYYAKLIKKEFPTPSLFKIMMFRMSRTSIKLIQDEEYYDYQYFKKNGWFQSDYYYPVKLNIIKKLFAKLFDKISAGMSKSR